jgi:hypothetical protein
MLFGRFVGSWALERTGAGGATAMGQPHSGWGSAASHYDPRRRQSLRPGSLAGSGPGGATQFRPRDPERPHSRRSGSR